MTSPSAPFDFNLDTTPAEEDSGHPVVDPIAFILWVIGFTTLTIAPAVVWAAWRWFL